MYTSALSLSTKLIFDGFNESFFDPGIRKQVSIRIPLLSVSESTGASLPWRHLAAPARFWSEQNYFDRFCLEIATIFESVALNFLVSVFFLVVASLVEVERAQIFRAPAKLKL